MNLSGKKMSRLTRDGTAEPVWRDQILRHVRGQGNIHFPSSADHEQDWQPYPVDPYSAIICDDHTYIVHTGAAMICNNSNISVVLELYLVQIKKNLNASRPSEHPPVRGGEMSKRLGGSCKDKTSSWHLTGFPNGNNFGSTV